jgi:cyclophilin family peptidyl-prolyl cis-trans isomerase
LAADVAVVFSDQVLETTDPITVALEGKFEESKVSSGTIVKFETNAPLSDNDFYVELTDNTPQTNANFLSYVNSGAYDNSIFHRSVPGFALQGGGFSAPQVNANQPGSDPDPISSLGTVQNEPGNLNTRGTIAMAKLGGQPDSATSQFFFNLSDNEHLNSDNGGYTVFGEVKGSGMTVVNTMASTSTYLADKYYADTSFKELPLYNLNADNIVRPNDFVKIENVDVVTASTDFDLFTYQVTSSDEEKLTASVDGNGNLVLTPDSSTTGSVVVTVTATSKLDTTSSAEQTFSVQLNGGGPVLTAIESSGVVLNQDQNSLLYAGDIALTQSGSELTTSKFNGFAPIAAETVSGVNYLAWQNTSTKFIYRWQMDAGWSFVDWTGINPGTAEFSQFEVDFDIDANGDGLTGSTRDRITTDTGTVALEANSATGVLYVGDLALTQSGSELTTSKFNGFAPIAAETVSGVNYLAWQNTSTKLIYRWQMDVSWSFVDWTGINPGTAEFSQFEVDFDIDANGDGNIGV